MALLPRETTSHALVLFESVLTYNKLKYFLINLAKNPGNLSVYHYGLFIKFLDERFDAICRTDASYFHYPEGRGNQSAIQLAKALTNNAALLQFTVDHYYDILMSKLRQRPYCLQKKALKHYQLHELILSDDLTPIEIQVVLDDALKYGIKDLYQSNDISKKLTAQEFERVRHHSEEAHDYYTAICAAYDGDEAHIKEARQGYHQALACEDYKVTASYGAESDKALKEIILRQLQSKDVLINLMQEIDPTLWPALMQLLSLEKLQQFFLPQMTFFSIVRNSNFITGQEGRDRIIFFILAELYARLRSLEKTYTSPLGYLRSAGLKFFGPAVTSYNIEEKVSAARELQIFLSSDCPLNQLHEYFNNQGRLRDALFEPAWRSELGTLVECIEKNYPKSKTLTLR